MRISHETKRAKKIIVELVRQAGGQFQNRTNLFHAFWKSHLAYALRNPGYLSMWPIIRMPNGLAIDDFDLLLAEMLADAWLTIGEAEVGPYRAMVFSLGPMCPSATLSEEAIDAIRTGLQEVVAKSTNSASDDSHRQSRVWREAKDGEELDIYLDLVQDEVRDRREVNFASLANAIDFTHTTSRK